MSASKDSTPIVFEWLERIGLGYAVPHFKERIVNPKALTALNIKDYEDLHVSDLGDRKRLYELVQRVRLASKSGSSASLQRFCRWSKPGGDGNPRRPRAAQPAEKLRNRHPHPLPPRNLPRRRPPKKRLQKKSSSIKSQAQPPQSTTKASGRRPQVEERERDARKRAKERVSADPEPRTGRKEAVKQSATATPIAGEANTRSTTPSASFYQSNGSRPKTDGSGSPIRVLDEK